MSRLTWLVVTGASGTGKTAAVNALEARGYPWLRCYYFDSIGVPSAAAMAREYGRGERWQEEATRQWIDWLASREDDGAIILEGQTRPSYVRAALAAVGRSDAVIVLFDCSTDVRRRRLVRRGQPELGDEQMEAWARYLRSEAAAMGVPVLDTGDRDVDELANVLESMIAQR
jgi:broad-specificity NMP kinase